MEWATAMLAAGHEGEHLAMLACDSAPHNHFELAPLRDRALVEVDAAPVHDRWALYVYVAERLKSGLARDGNLAAAVRAVGELYSGNGHDSALFDFDALRSAYEAIQQGEQQWEWPGATRDTIYQIMRQRAQDFVDEVESIDTTKPDRDSFSISQRPSFYSSARPRPPTAKQ